MKQFDQCTCKPWHFKTGSLNRTDKKEISAWGKTRNKAARKINWRFTTYDATIKFKRLYLQFV